MEDVVTEQYVWVWIPTLHVENSDIEKHSQYLSSELPQHVSLC